MFHSVRHRRRRKKRRRRRRINESERKKKKNISHGERGLSRGSFDVLTSDE